LRFSTPSFSLLPWRSSIPCISVSSRLASRRFLREIISEIRVLLPRHRRASVAVEVFVAAARERVGAPQQKAPLGRE
jgi:hypothetical protein